MLRPIFRLLALTSLVLATACQTMPDSSADGWISGRVVDVAGNPINASLSIGDAVFTTDATGRFAITPPQDAVYRIEVSAEGHYPMRHTFSHAELVSDPALGAIVLVARAPNRTLFVFGGDAMIGRRFYEPFEGEPVLVSKDTALADSKALLAEMKPYLERADYASVNLETPIFDSPPSDPAPKFVTFYSAPETLEALEWAGVDYAALGNNHTYDFLEPGLNVTLDHLNDSSLDFSGAGKDEAEALAAHRHASGGAAFDLLSFVGWPAGPPTQSAGADKGGAALGTVQNLLSTTQRSITTGGIPILQFHGGLEYVEEPTLSIETNLKQAIDGGAALVIGHHPHVVQGLELYEGKLIAWSLGNFLFDQYFYSAQSAALLYVWMDGDEFHHAEAVPLYIKGYHPTPALGPMRNAINQRLFKLSAKRATNLAKSGGHMILWRSEADPEIETDFAVAIDCQGGALRTGQDLLARGDFDSHFLFDAPDRSWLDLDERISIRSDTAAPWNNALHIHLSENESVTTGMRKFQRVFTRATPMLIRGSVTASAQVEVNVYLQVRADGQGLADALQNGRKIHVGKATLNANEKRDIDFSFDSPKNRARSIRVLLEVQSKDAATNVEIDDLELIEWQTPFQSENAICSDAFERKP
jgi:poly-gamma-glutamate capsule biosynthesis protein CapA/YwtB (metallophosphatase superfamily)